MDIRSIWKQCCETTKNIWQKVCQRTKNVIGLVCNFLMTVSYTTYGALIGLVLVIAVVGLTHHTKDSVGVIVEKIGSTEQKLAALEKKLDTGSNLMLSGKLTSTEQRLESLEKKLDGIQEKQDRAHLALVNEKIKNEVERQVLAQKALKEKRKKVLRNMLDAIADDDQG